MLKEEKKQKIENGMELNISSRRTKWIQVVLLLVIVVIPFILIVLYSNAGGNSWLILASIIIKLQMLFLCIFLISHYSVSLKGKQLICSRIFGKTKYINIDEIDEIITLGHLFHKHILIRYHENGREKIMFILHPTFLSSNRDSYYALLYAHYYYKENIKIY